MANLQVEAVYQKGTLKLLQKLPLHEGQKVTITVQAAGPTQARRRGLIHWKGKQEDLDYLILSDDNDCVEAP